MASLMPAVVAGAQQPPAQAPPAVQQAPAVAAPVEEVPAAPEPAAVPELSAGDEAALREALAADADADPAPEPPPIATAPAPGPAPIRSAPSLNPDISLIADFALAAFSDVDRSRQSGAHDPVANGFNLQQLELSVGAAVDPYFRFDANLVFGLFGVEIEEAYATTLGLPHRLQLRAGQFLTRFGRRNPTHPHTWYFVDQPFALGRVFGAEGARGLGAELSWLSSLPWYLELVTSTQMAAGEASARSFYGGSDPGVRGPLDLQQLLAIKQFFPLGDDWSLSWGISGAFGPNGSGRGNRSEIFGSDLYLKWRPISRQSVQVVSLHTEWFYRRRQVPEAVLQDVDSFSEVFWRFTQRWAVAARHDYGSPIWDSELARQPDELDPDWTDHRHRFAANVTFWPTEFSRLRLQPSIDLPLWQDDPIYAVFLAFEVVTGAHGSHPF
ncbi:MAG: zinc-regulated TonB-dependent outer membrane receptor [Myxococcales bacterium]|nr:zinc-regulated TonB-dependent outer membrane receptor [Myxococcales bacterium]